MRDIDPIALHRLSAEAATAGDLATHNYCEMLLSPRHWPAEQLEAAAENIWRVLDDAAAQCESEPALAPHDWDIDAPAHRRDRD